jgi:protease I
MKRCMLWSVVLMVGLSLTTVFAENQQNVKGGKLKGKKIVMIIAQRQFEGTEFKEPKDILEREGAKIIVACSTLSEATSMGFYSLIIKPNILINDIKVRDFDAIVFIGGFGCAEYFDNPVAHKIAKEALKQDKILAAICMAPRILANAGVLKGKKVTCFPSVREDIKIKGAIVTGEMVERDGKIITGNGPPASTKFGETITSALSE